MDTSRLAHMLFQHLPEFFKRKLSQRENHVSPYFTSQLSLFASMTNLHHNDEEHLIYDTDGGLLFMQTTQSNLSLFNVSCDSLHDDEHDDCYIKSRATLRTNKHYMSTIDIHFEMKQINYRSTMIFSEDMDSSQTNTLQRWKGLELLNTYA